MDAQRGIARRMVIGLPPDGLAPAWEKDFAAYPPAGVILFRRDFKDLEDLRGLTARLRSLARPRRLFVTIDEEGGFVSQLAGHLAVPPNALLLARGGEPGDIEWASRVTGSRLRSLGVDWVFAPVADIHSEPRNPVIGPRSFGTDASSVSRAIGEALRGFRESGIASCLKHFPGHGDTVLDSHVALPRSNADRDTLSHRELEPFRAHLEADSVMTAHLVVPALDPERPGTFSRAIAHDLLRGTLGFTGVSITDALEMKGAADGRTPADAARMALEAGCDLLLFAFHDPAIREVRLTLARDLVDGRIAREPFDEARPRLARLDRERPEPNPSELATPIESLTPADWEARLERVIERGLIVRGSLPSGPWEISEPDYAHGENLRAELARRKIPITDVGAVAGIECIATRKPLPDSEVDRLRRECRARPTALIGLQNDAFLEDFPEAALRVSAADSTPLTRCVLARTLAAFQGASART